MHPAISYELATARIADLRRQAQRGFGQQLWTLLRAQVLLDGPPGIREAVEECVRQLGQAGREEANGEERSITVMTGQTRAGAAPASALTATDRITPAAASTLALRVCAAAGPLFVAAAVVQALTRPGFNLTRNALSLLDDGNLGWIQAANFIVTGLLLIAASVAVRRAITAGPGSRWAPRLLAITGAGLIGGGIFHPDPSGGFPPGTPQDASAISSWHGVLHEVSGSTAFLALIIFCFVAARRYRACGQPAAAACSVAAGVLCAAGVATGGAPDGSLTLFAGVSIALLWAAFTITRLTIIRSLP